MLWSFAEQIQNKNKSGIDKLSTPLQQWCVYVVFTETLVVWWRTDEHVSQTSTICP